MLIIDELCCILWEELVHIPSIFHNLKIILYLFYIRCDFYIYSTIILLYFYISSTLLVGINLFLSIFLGNKIIHSIFDT